MKEEIEKKRAEAAEKRQKVDTPEVEAKTPLKSVGPKGFGSKVGKHLPSLALEQSLH